MQVTEDFPFNGEPSALVLSRLGLPQDTLIKIRRVSPTGGSTKTNLKTFGGPETDRQRAERMWATMKDLRRDNISRSMHAAPWKGGVAKGDGHAAKNKDHIDIFPVTPAEVIKAGDVLFLSCAKASDYIVVPRRCLCLRFARHGRHGKCSAAL